ncbi:negative regulation of toll-like receptor signaling pathway [Mactra antiquata]
MFKALDRVNYDALQLNKRPEKQCPNKVKSLTDLSSVSLNLYQCLLYENLHLLPLHLIQKQLYTALTNDQGWAIEPIIANWPFEVLRFADGLSVYERKKFEENLEGDYFHILEGIIKRTKHCKLKCLDFTGLKLDHTTCAKIIRYWPFMSFKGSLQTIRKIINSFSSLPGIDLFVWQMIKIMIDSEKQNLLDSRRTIRLPRGVKLEVKIDNVTVSSENIYNMLQYFITSSIRHITPLFVTVTNLTIDPVMSNNNLIDFLVLKVQDKESLKGLCFPRLEEDMLLGIQNDLTNFTNLHSLDLQNCELYLKEGKTRNCTKTRKTLCDLLSSFNHLQRLDISRIYLYGCLGEILDALRKPLVYLGVRFCDLKKDDIDSLVSSKHSSSLRELNLSGICKWELFNDKDLPINLLKALQHFPNISVLDISDNNFLDSDTEELCEILSHKLPRLRGLDISENLLKWENLLKLVKACCSVSTMQLIKLTCIEGLELSVFDDVIQRFGGQDILVQNMRWSRILAIGGHAFWL